MPDAEFSQFRSVVNADRSCDFEGDKFFCYCWFESYADFPPLTMSLGSGEIETSIPPETYMFKKGFKCFFRIQPGPFGQSEWVLGAVFLKHYYAVFAPITHEIGLALSKYEAQVDHWI